MLESLSAMELVPSKRLKRVSVKDWVVWVMSVSEARFKGMDAGCWTARKVNTIWGNWWRGSLRKLEMERRPYMRWIVAASKKSPARSATASIATLYA